MSEPLRINPAPPVPGDVIRPLKPGREAQRDRERRREEQSRGRKRSPSAEADELKREKRDGGDAPPTPDASDAEGSAPSEGDAERSVHVDLRV